MMKAMEASAAEWTCQILIIYINNNNLSDDNRIRVIIIEIDTFPEIEVKDDHRK